MTSSRGAAAVRDATRAMRDSGQTRSARAARGHCAPLSEQTMV